MGFFLRTLSLTELTYYQIHQNNDNTFCPVKAPILSAVHSAVPSCGFVWSRMPSFGFTHSVAKSELIKNSRLCKFQRQEIDDIMERITDLEEHYMSEQNRCICPINSISLTGT